jgi:hypothetical protein
MNLHVQTKAWRGRRAGQRGSATLVVLILLMLLVALLIGNSRALIQLKGELRLVEEKQVQRYAPKPASHTAPANPAPRRSP